MLQQRIINGKYTELYIDQNGGGGESWITEAKATIFHNFWKSKILTAGESADQFREVTDKEKTALETTREQWVRPSQHLIDRWNDAFTQYSTSNSQQFQVRQKFGMWNEETGYFEANEITDISTSEATRILKYITFGANKSMAYLAVSDVRTIPPIFSQYNSAPARPTVTLDMMFYNSTSLEVININARNWSSEWTVEFIPNNTDTNLFYNCIRLRKIIGTLNIRHFSNLTINMFGRCENLEYVFIKYLPNNCTLILKDCPKFNYTAIKYILDNCLVSSGATINLHPDIYTALIGEAQFPFNGGTQEEWTQLLTDAAEKNITFTT